MAEQEHGSLAESGPGTCAEFNACNNLLLKSAASNPDEVDNILKMNAHMRETEW
jgi:hypothetical protein